MQPWDAALGTILAEAITNRMKETEESDWPPEYSLDKERILDLLTGDRFYSDASAALREAVLNAIDAVHRRQHSEPDLKPVIKLTFDRAALALAVEDNGDGMSQADVSTLFARIGASASQLGASEGLVGEFGIGAVSYFMAGETFEIQTFDGTSQPIGLRFRKAMFAGGKADELDAKRTSRGTTLTLALKSVETFDLLLKKFSHWCRDVNGLDAVLVPDGHALKQGGAERPDPTSGLQIPDWIERTHLAPISRPSEWNGMFNTSTIAVLYKGVFVQELATKRLWGIEGSIDVSPKRSNRS